MKEGTGLKSLTPNFLPRNPPQCKRMETNSLHFIKHDTVVLWGGGERGRVSLQVAQP